MTTIPNALARCILSDTADAVIFADPEGAIRLWNDAATALFGFTAGDALGVGLNVSIPERLRQLHWHSYRQALATGATRLLGRPTITRACTRAEGVSFAVVRDASGEVAGSVAVARDATAQFERARATRGNDDAAGT